jgi:thioesterase domain-containing protein
LATRTKIKPLHFVSTVSVFDSPEYGAVGTIDENQPLDALSSLQGGYAQSKCVAEKLVRTAGQRGLPVTIHRPGRVTGDSITGAESLADYTTLLLRLCIEMGTAPTSEDRVDMTPVDYVAQAVVGLGQRPESTGKTFHLINPRAVPVRDVYQAIRACGYDLQEVPFDVWQSSTIQWGRQSQDESFVAFAHWLMLMSPLTGTLPIEPTTAPQAVTIACDQTLRDLQPLGVSCPIVNVDQLKRQVQFLMRRNVVSPPKLPIGKWRPLVPLRATGSARPLFCIHGLGGHVVALLPLAQGLADGRPVYGLQARGLEPGQEPQGRIEEMAASYIQEIRDVQPQGPYLLGGWSMGGLIALEAAQQLLLAGQEVGLVAMLDTYLSLRDFQYDVDDQAVLRRIASQLNVPIAELNNLPLEQQWDRIAKTADLASGTGIDDIRRLAAACREHLRALSHYEIRPYAGPCVLFTSVNSRSGRDRRWKEICPKLCIEPASGDHFGMLREPDVQVLAKRLDRYLQ